MDVFKFQHDTDDTDLHNGELVNGIESVTWTERYSEPGEFEIKAPLSSDLRNILPLGCMISHVDTMEVMMVEDHHIIDSKGDTPQISVTGRSLSAYLENRIVGVNLARDTGMDPYTNPYEMTSARTWDQAVQLINDHIYAPYDAGDILIDVMGDTDLTGSDPGTSEARQVDFAPVSEKVKDLLAIDDLGIRTVRSHSFPYPIGDDATTIIWIYKGIDRSASVKFSWESGDLDETEYLFSTRKFKTSAFVVGKLVYTVVDLPGYSNFDRRMMKVDGSGVDGNMTENPTSFALPVTVAWLQTKGKQALARQNRIHITRADVSDMSRFKYREDYNLGDIVTLDADYNTSMKTRVIEYVEIQDETGFTGHPTLTLPTGV